MCYPSSIFFTIVCSEMCYPSSIFFFSSFFCIIVILNALSLWKKKEDNLQQKQQQQKKMKKRKQNNDSNNLNLHAAIKQGSEPTCVFLGTTPWVSFLMVEISQRYPLFSATPANPWCLFFQVSEQNHQKNKQWRQQQTNTKLLPTMSKQYNQKSERTNADAIWTRSSSPLLFLSQS